MYDVLLIHAVFNVDTNTSVDIGAIIGGAVAMVFILAVVVIASIALVLRRKQNKETQPQ